ncbi:MAG TPA: hypothetical protein VHO03_19060 [Ignavibacteriales bacterium]|nr:hypothetical protein [Ignavibacteriales bacterium]
MININRIPKILWFVVMFLFISIAAYGQDTSKVPSSAYPSSTPSTYPSTPQSTNPSGYPSTAPSTSTQSTQSPRSQDLSFNAQAAKLANELVTMTGISTDKAPDVVKVLKDYRDDLADARAKYLEKHPNANLDQETTGSSTGSSANVNMKGILGNNVDKYYAGASSDLMSDYKDADKSADKKIKKIFDNDVQTSRYEQSKGQWWSDVKDQVFSSLKQSSQYQNQNETK